MPLSLGKIEQDIGKTVDFKREIDCLFLLQKFKYKQLSNTVVAFLIGGILE